MKIYQISITSKNKNSIKTFFKKVIELFANLNSNIAIFNRKQKKKVLTILKSPHVNKKAQDQFQIINYSKTINCCVPRHLNAIFIFKTLKSNLFTDIKIKIKLTTDDLLSKKLQIKTVNINNIKLKLFYIEKNSYNTKRFIKKIHYFFYFLDIYGELHSI